MNSLRTQWTTPGLSARLLALVGVLAPLSMGTKECELVEVGDDRADAGEPEPATCSYAGQTYELGASFPSSDGCNTCSCSEQGVECTLVFCLTDCGGFTGASCPADEYCLFAPETACGAGDQTGSCQPRPDACDANYDPVCGCDDRTYGNACEAASAGVSIARQGECDAAQGCVHEGQSYAVGDEVPSDDCNRCYCEEDGSVACTLIDCAPSTCKYGDSTYYAGESFPASDGCNTCSCGPDGAVSCTDAACGT